MACRERRRGLVVPVTLGAVLLLGLSAGTASASSVRTAGSKLVIEAGVGEGANIITVTRQGPVLVVDGTPDMNAGEGCRQSSRRRASCPASATRISTNLRDGDDEFVSSAVDLAVVLNGGTGGDTVSTGARRDRLEGESGDDDLSAGPGNDRLNDGPGVDSLNGEEGNDRLDGVDGGAESELDCGRGIDRASLDLVDVNATSRGDIAAKLATGRSFLKLIPPTNVLGCENDGVASGDQQPTLRVVADDARLGRRSISVPLLCPASRGCKGRFELGRKDKALGDRSYDLGGGEQRRLHFGLSRSTGRSLRGKRLRGVALERDPRGRPKAAFASFKPRRR